jgi:hypothetical protein
LLLSARLTSLACSRASWGPNIHILTALL